jgi:hypothetical protein
MLQSAEDADKEADFQNRIGNIGGGALALAGVALCAFSNVLWGLVVILIGLLFAFFVRVDAALVVISRNQLVIHELQRELIKKQPEAREQ